MKQRYPYVHYSKELTGAKPVYVLAKLELPNYDAGSSLPVRTVYITTTEHPGGTGISAQIYQEEKP